MLFAAKAVTMNWCVYVYCELNFVRDVRYFKLHKVNSLSIIKVLLVLFLTLTVSAVSAFALVNAAYAFPAQHDVYAWGRNDLGQLGIGGPLPNPNNISLPTAAILPDGVRGWSEFYAGPLHNMAIATDGRLFVWGCNSSGDNAAGNPMFGKLGIGSTAASYNTPQPISFPPGVRDWQDVQLALWHTLALCIDGNLFAWGRNQEGQLGIGSSTANYNTPQPVPFPPDVDYWVAIAGRYSTQGHSLAIANTGELFAWGHNNHGQLGLGGPIPGQNQNTPQLVPRPLGVDGWSRVYTGQGHTVAICTNGNLFSWGQNNYGQLGLGGSIPGQHQSTPQPVPLPTQIDNWDTLYVGTNYVRVITPEGRFVGWGQNDAGQLGTGNLVHSSSPVLGLMPAGITGWYKVFSGNNHSLALTHPCADYPHGRWFAWGWNMGGRLGLGPNYPFESVANVHTPREITHNMPIPPAGTNWTAFLATHTALVILSPRDIPPAFLEKTLRLNEGTLIPNPAPSFTFNFQEIGSAPAIPPQTIAVDPTTATTENGITTVTGELNLLTLIQGALDNANVSGGAWMWEVSEVANSSSINASADPNAMAYDDSRFRIRAYTNRHGVVTSLIIHRMVQNAQDEWEIVEPKLDDIGFVNTYTRIIGCENQAALYLSKMIAELEFANLSTPFTFELTLTNPAITPPYIGSAAAGTVTAEVVNATTGAFIRTVSITAGLNTFTLAHNEMLRIPELPSGTRFQITEPRVQHFRPEATVTGAIPVPPATGNYPQQAVYTDLVTYTYIAHQGNENRASFINTHQHTPPTGLVITTAPWLALAVTVVLLLALLVASRNRKRIEELPMVF